MTKNKTKVCYVLSYRAPRYVRSQVLTAALAKLPDVELSLARNSTKSILRYPQTLWRLIVIRLTKRPHIYILGFRGQEIYWPVRLLTIGRPLIFDEFINMHEWLGVENNKLPNFMIKFADWYERAALKSCRLILADTYLDAKSSSQDFGISLDKYRVIYVGADEVVFKPRLKEAARDNSLEVFFYGNMAPLHGINYLLETINDLKSEPIHFTLVGGKGRPATVKNINNFIKTHDLNNVTYHSWVNTNKLSTMMAQADLFLGGPFGGTAQAQRVITGKTYQTLAMGIATMVGRTNEDAGFKDKVNCLLVDQGSTEALTKAIKWALTHKPTLPKIGYEGLQLYKDRFSVQKVSQQLQTIIDEIQA